MTDFKKPVTVIESRTLGTGYGLEQSSIAGTKGQTNAGDKRVGRVSDVYETEQKTIDHGVHNRHSNEI
jgi:hypothetical protein